MLKQSVDFRLRRELVQDEILNALRNAIVSGDLRPGERLNETTLCEHFGVSRAPLREALKQLSADGLLISVPHKGSFVVELTVQDVREIYSLRQALEALAVELLVETITAEQIEALNSIIDEMREAVANGDMWAVVDLDMRLHQTICEFSGHGRLYISWVRMGDLLRTFFAAARPLYDDYQVTERHIVLVDAIASGDKEKAVSTLKEHISNAAELVLVNMENRSK
jgi:DNA-binding GntR family transcriptional regulator